MKWLVFCKVLSTEAQAKELSVGSLFYADLSVNENRRTDHLIFLTRLIREGFSSVTLSLYLIMVLG